MSAVFSDSKLLPALKIPGTTAGGEAAPTCPVTPVRILVAEDQPAIRHWLVKMLEKWGYEVTAVGDGAAAWRVLQAPDAPQLALLDWMMPEMDGPQVCRAVRQQIGHIYIYILLLTARDKTPDIIAGLEAGADDYLVKPPDPFELKARLNTGRRILDLQSQLRTANERLRVQATHDVLTSLWNRAAIMELFEREWAGCQRDAKPLGILMADLDHFKRINDTHGHLAGDAVLRAAARRMQEVLRPVDMIGRYGGEEFLVLLPGCAEEHLIPLAERLRHAVAAEAVQFGEQQIPVTVSMGGASTVAKPNGSLMILLNSADEALYKAKADGRNCVRIGPSSPQAN